MKKKEPDVKEEMVLVFDDGSFSPVTTESNGTVDLSVECRLVDKNNKSVQSSELYRNLDEDTAEQLRRKVKTHSIKLESGEIKLSKNRKK